MLKDLSEGKQDGDDDGNDDGDDGDQETFEINMFTMTPVGGAMMCVGIVAMAVMHRLLPNRSSSSAAVSDSPTTLDSKSAH